MRITIDTNRRSLIRVLGAIWAVAWFGLFLEIYRWHHVTPTLHLNPPTAVPGLPPPQPGGFLIAVLASSALTPPAFLVLVAWELLERARTRSPRS